MTCPNPGVWSAEANRFAVGAVWHSDIQWNLHLVDLSKLGLEMDTVEVYLTRVFNMIVNFAERLDSTGWLILATCTVIAGYSLLKGPGIRGV